MEWRFVSVICVGFVPVPSSASISTNVSLILNLDVDLKTILHDGSSHPLTTASPPLETPPPTP